MWVEKVMEFGDGFVWTDELTHENPEIVNWATGTGTNLVVLMIFDGA